MAVTVKSILDATLTILMDAKATRWTDVERLGWLNEGLRELIVLHPEAKVKRVPVTLAIGARQSLPADCHLLLGVETAAGGVVLPCERAMLNAFDPGWMKRKANDVVHYLYAPEDPLVFYVYPAQSGDKFAVELKYSAYPQEAVADGSLDVLDKYASNLINFVLYRCFAKDAEYAGAAELAASYLKLFAG